VPTVIVACIAVFIVEMWVNDCPKHGSALGAGQGCVAGFLRRFSFQPLRENPLLGPSSATYVPSSVSPLPLLPFCCHGAELGVL
jgi:hypothetical protein